ncbi:hypothetical protein RRG08_066333 [Elysia crispata]|uniref:C-type lectin domain-containing protein n=1 Tax=Elysia crispata TaxID=231223 RepID=A0AAE1ADR7_9GAST|nr:hypothetical protein RRG08_066333 [Elysia crispata]
MSCAVGYCVFLGSFLPEVNCLATRENFDLVSDLLNYTEADQECWTRGFDGLALLRSPAQYRYVLKASTKLRLHKGLWIALRFDPDLGKFQWNDGTDAALDTPWDITYTQENLLSEGHLCGLMRTVGLFGMLNCSKGRYAICGRRNTNFQEAFGTTVDSFFLDPAKSHSLESLTVESYPPCAILCGGRYDCRAAVFDPVTLTCSMYGPGVYTVHYRAGVKAFVRQGFIGNNPLARVG